MLYGKPRTIGQLLRWLLVGVLIPACFGCVNTVWLAYVGESRDQQLFCTMIGILVFQVGVTGWLCGKFIEWPLLRWLIYGSCWMLLDVQLISAMRLATRSPGGMQLLQAMFVAQVGLGMIWGVLGTSNWRRRVPLSMVAIAALSAPLILLRRTSSYVDLVFLVQTLALLALCGLVRLQGFRLFADRAGDSEQPDPATGGDSRLRDIQFGMRHMLALTTSMALALGLVRALALAIRLDLGSIGPLPLACWAGIAAVSAISMLVALWAVLGTGAFWQRWLLMAITPGLSAYAVAVVKQFEEGLHLRGGWEQLFAPDTVIWKEWTLATQAALTPALVFATLLIFRQLGYRLRRPVVLNEPEHGWQSPANDKAVGRQYPASSGIGGI